MAKTELRQQNLLD